MRVLLLECGDGNSWTVSDRCYRVIGPCQIATTMSPVRRGDNIASAPTTNVAMGLSVID